MSDKIIISWCIEKDNLTKLDSINTKLNRSQKLNKLLDYILTQDKDTIKEFFTN